jgi:hypothetical protein
MHKAAQDGTEIPTEHYDAYEKKFAEGYFDKEPEPKQPEPAPEPEPKQPEPNYQKEATEAKESYTKLVSDTDELLKGMANGDPQAIAAFQKITGKAFQPPQAPPNAEPEANPWKITPEQAEAAGVMDMAVIDLLNGQIDKVVKHYDSKTESMSADVNKYKSSMQEQERAAHTARISSSITDEVMAVTGKGRYGDVTREQIDAFRKNPAECALPEKLATTLRVYADVQKMINEGKLEMSLEDVDRLLYYNEDMANAKMSAAKANQQHKPTVGVNGSGGAVDLANLTPEQMQAMANGNMDIPDKFLDEDGMPIPGVCPKELTALLTGAA